MKKYISIIILFLLVIILVIVFGDSKDYIKNSDLYISEIVASNSYTLMDNDGDYSDYIEIYNDSKNDLNLDGYMLSDKEYEPKKWSFPNIIIKSKEYLIIYASGKNKCDIDKKICHTNFKLSSDGEVVTLTDDFGNIISKVRYPKLGNDLSYSYAKRKYIITEPSAFSSNNLKEIKKSNIKKGDIIINEYMTHNKRNHYLSDGGYYDWVELYNNSDKDINLKGLYLSDDGNNLNKFKLPDKVLKKGEYLVVYLTDGVNVDNYICANFKIGDDEEIVLSNGDTVIDKIKTISLKDNISYGLKNNEWVYFSVATPGSENNTQSFSKEEWKNGSS